MAQPPSQKYVNVAHDLNVILPNQQQGTISLIQWDGHCAFHGGR
jgi:hypothetical protein